MFTDGVEGVLANAERIRKRWEHVQCTWQGLCKDCNYNVPAIEGDNIVYIKERSAPAIPLPEGAALV